MYLIVKVGVDTAENEPSEKFSSLVVVRQQTEGLVAALRTAQSSPQSKKRMLARLGSGWVATPPLIFGRHE